VIYTDGIYYACGTNGMDYSKDGGETWQNLNDFNTFSMAFDSPFIYASSINGKVIKLKKVK
jgi:Neuraminidase (sialidase)